jgi:selenocysteine lyase/cysteine desulfurase
LTDLSEPAQAWGVAAVYIDGIDVRDLAKFLMDKYRIVVVPLVGGAPPNSVFDYQAIRVSPNVYTTLEEIDMFVMAIEDALKGGVPTELAAARRGPVEGVNWTEII